MGGRRLEGEHTVGCVCLSLRGGGRQIRRNYTSGVMTSERFREVTGRPSKKIL